MKIYTEVVQGTLEWLTVRAGKVTASELKNIITPNFAIRTGEMPQTYLYKKVAEAYLGKPLPDEDFSSYHTENGVLLEDEARKFFCFNYDHAKLHNAGFVEHDDGRFGCSPDALIGEDSGLEIKAPMSKTHVKYLLNGELPPEYAPQVHGSIYATGRKSWKFMSYARKFPAFVLTVQRDEEIMARIAEALAGFYAKFDEAMAKMKEAEQFV